MNKVVFPILFSIILLVSIPYNASADFPPPDNIRVLISDPLFDDEAGAVHFANIEDQSQGLIFSDPNAEEMENVQDLAVNSDGIIFAAFTTLGTAPASSVAVIDSNVPDGGGTTTSELLSTFPQPDSGDFGDLTGIAIDSNGDVFISDFLNNVIYQYTESSTPNEFEWVKTISGFSDPLDIAIDPFGGTEEVWVLQDSVIYNVDVSSETLTTFSHSMFEPKQIAFISDDTAIVTSHIVVETIPVVIYSSTLYSVDLSTPPTVVISTFDDLEFERLHGVTYDSVNDDLYIGERIGQKLILLDSTNINEAGFTEVYVGSPWNDILGITNTIDTETGGEFSGDLQLTKVGPEFAVEGDLVTYTITVDEVGGGTDTLPDATVTDNGLIDNEGILDFQFSVPPVCVQSGFGATCPLGQFPAGEQRILEMTWRVGNGAPIGIDLTNEAIVTTTADEPKEEEGGAPNDDDHIIQVISNENAYCLDENGEPTELNQYIDDEVNIILGTSGDDILVGTSDADVILGLGGNDIINGMGGDDCLVGGAGDDTIHGDDPNDPLIVGNDEIFGDDPNDGSVGDDTLFGDDGDDIIRGGPEIVADFCDLGPGQVTGFEEECENFIDLVLDTTGTPSEAPAGSVFDYSVTTENIGTETANDVVIEVTLESTTFLGFTGPATQCSIPVGNPGVVHCDIGDVDGGVIVGPVIISVLIDDDVDGTLVQDEIFTDVELLLTDENQVDNDPESNQEEIQIDVTPAEADMAIDKIGPQNSVSVGQSFDYTLDITNNGPSRALGITIVDDYPENEMSFEGTTTPDFTCTDDTPIVGEVTCTYDLVLDPNHTPPLPLQLVLDS